MAYKLQKDVEWHTKVDFLEKVTGQDIVKKCDEIDESEGMFSIATQIFSIPETTRFNCFITYKVHRDTLNPPQAVKKIDLGIMKKRQEVTEEFVKGDDEE